MNLDWSKVFKPVTESVTTSTAPTRLQADKPSSQNVQPVNDVCECGHEEIDHEGDGDCTILECACTSFMPPSHKYDVNSMPSWPNGIEPTSVHVDEIHQELSPEGEILNETVREFIDGPTSIQAVERMRSSGVPLPAPNKDITEASEDDGCAHLCKCGKWWSHGARMKCRHPDLVSFGLCAECLNGKPQLDVTVDYVDGKLTPKGIQNCYNKARVDCADMTQEQIGHHIEYLMQRIEELRSEAISARKIRAELIEEEVSKVDPSEREAFRQELLRGKASKTPRKSSGKEAPRGPNFEEISAAYTAVGLSTPDQKVIKLVAGLMSQMHKSAAEIVRFLND